MLAAWVLADCCSCPYIMQAGWSSRGSFFLQRCADANVLASRNTVRVCMGDPVRHVGRGQSLLLRVSGEVQRAECEGGACNTLQCYFY